VQSPLHLFTIAIIVQKQLSAKGERTSCVVPTQLYFQDLTAGQDLLHVPKFGNLRDGGTESTAAQHCGLA
jgi:hypothetical protein